MEPYEYSYIQASTKIPIEKNVPFYLHGMRYEMHADSWYFYNNDGYNGEIFNLIGYDDPNNLFEEVLGHGNYVAAGHKQSPYAKNSENATKIILKILQTPKFKRGTTVRIKSDLHEGNNYGVYCNEQMVEFAGKEVIVDKTEIYSCGRFGYNITYCINELDGKNIPWCWTEDMFEDMPILMFVNAPISVLASEEKEKKLDTKIQPNKELEDKSNVLNTHISIQLPKHSKNLKVTL